MPPHDALWWLAAGSLGLSAPPRGGVANTPGPVVVTSLIWRSVIFGLFILERRRLGAVCRQLVGTLPTVAWATDLLLGSVDALCPLVWLGCHRHQFNNNNSLRLLYTA